MAIVNPSFNTVSQVSHVGVGFLFTAFPVIAFHVPLHIAQIVVVGLAAAKEYADSNGLETPEVAGNSWQDFAFWVVGIGLAGLAFWIGKQ